MSHAARSTDPSTGSDPTATRRLGIVLDAIGVGIVIVAIAVTIVQAGSVTAADDGSASAASGWADWSAGTIAVPFVLLLFAMCALIPGEILRRGVIESADGEQARTALPRASFVAEFRPLGLSVHGLWAAILIVVAALLSLGLALSAAGGSWPVDVADRGDYSIVGSFGAWTAVIAGIAGATVGSFVKKSVYVRVVRRGGTVADDVRGRAFWTWFSMRWRFDLWLCAAGGVSLAFSVIALVDDAVATVVFGLVGCVLLAAGLITASNYWRAGVPLGVGESFL